MTLTTEHFLGSNPAAITLKTTSCDVKIPATCSFVSLTKTAVVLFSFINMVASCTDALTFTYVGTVLASKASSNVGPFILFFKVSKYWKT